MSMASADTTAAPHGTVVTYRDDGPLARAMALLISGQIPPLPPVIAGAFVTGALLLAGATGRDDLAMFAPAVLLLLAGSGGAHAHDGRLDWLVPPILRLTEYGFITAVGFGRSISPVLIFALLGALAFHHYDVVYRVRQHVCPPPWLAAVGLGWDGRLLIVAVAGLFDTVTMAFVLLAGYLWGVYGWESVTCWGAAPGGGTAASGGGAAVPGARD
ncbi:DUF5941 domain-containing protein [Sphaerimonospora thailandensis]|uniref:DUF5941 domain-containing protein n=1 Tax=Sphaerimonospora thailandensis TaxID=795644 RepID=A0A8J3W132_9ACTN|nr:DUF5941 domain-containing protein [Sphaerimonospora thailandensis]GIH72272.1 hypothetical protein Mth01_45250 [Sphaerimonospora thailandensis]